MNNFADVNGLAKIYENNNSIIYRGRREKDSQPVIIKMLKEDYPTPIQLVRYHQEFELTRNLNLKGIVRVYELQKYQNSLAIIFEDLGAESLGFWLRNCQLNLLDFLDIAIKITEILDSVHQAKIIHKDINPSNIIYNPKTKEIRLIDFGIATNLLQENPSPVNIQSIEGTFAYISPEQTGRMNRAIDYRTDLYSLGVTFYELLTKQLPFESSDPLELVHCHLAKQPIPPHLVRGEEFCPKLISDIVMKLMSKTAEERYQSAYGVRVDLELCRDRLQQTGKIDNFLLGRQDFSDKFQIPQKLYGREKQITMLLTAFEKVNLGQTELILVSGYSGIGKTALVREIYKPITKERGYFISGKFDLLQRDIPYLGIIKAFQELVRQLLGETEIELQNWRKKILAALGSNGRVIIDAIPEVETIIGQQPTVPELEPNEAQNRFNLVFSNFIRVFCQQQHPLVIFLDDLQWADSATLHLIKVIATDLELKYLFLIGAYRDNEVEQTHPLSLTLADLKKQEIAIDEIALPTLELSTVIQLVADTLKCNLQAAYPLAKLVFSKTQGNPFFINEFLKTLDTENLLKFDFVKRRWQWNIEKIQTQNITDNVAELMVEKIQKLPPSSQQNLQLAACIGEQFDLKTLSIVNETSLKTTAEQLWLAVETGLIFPVGDNYKFIQTNPNFELKVIYQFAHDRIQQAAYSLISEDRKPLIHLHIGNLLFNSLSQRREEKIFELVNHLNYGIHLLEEPQRIELAKLNLNAGKKAKASAAYQPAQNYLQHGIALLSIDAWEQQYDLALTLYTEAAEVAYLYGNSDEMERLAAVVRKQARTLIDTIEVDEIAIFSYIARNQMLEAVNIALQVLKRLEIELPDRPSTRDIGIACAQTQATIGERKPSQLAQLPPMTDPKSLAAIQILSGVAAAAYFAVPSLYPLLVFKMVGLLATYGNMALSSFIYASYGLLLCSAIGDIEAGYEFGRLASTLSEQQEHKRYRAKTLFLINHFIIHWKEHAKATLQPLQSAYLSALESGDLQYTGFSVFVYSLNSYFLGKGLVELEQEIANYSHTLKNLKQQTVLNYNQIYHQGILNLIDRTEDPCCLIGTAYDETVMLPLHQQASDRTAIVYLFINKLILCYLFEDFDRAVQNADMAKQYLDGTQGNLAIAVFYFYDSLIQAAIFKQSPQQQQTIRDRILQNQAKMKQWASFAPMNFAHKYYLVEAEWLRVLNETSEAMDCYDRAIELARQYEYFNDEAIACELAAKFYLEKGHTKIARTYFQDAHYGYLRWGATAKVKDLETRYTKLLDRLSCETPTQTGERSTFKSMTSSSALDLMTVMKASQTLSEEIVLEKLLKKLMQTTIENAGAQRGFLILEHQGQLLVEAARTVDTDEIDLLRSLPITDKNFKSRVPTSMINYVARTRESIVLNDATHEGKFTRDRYISAKQAQIKSVLCTPLLHQGKLLGVVYLENNLATGAFTSERLEMVKLLCSQGAISLENARLYAEKEEYAQTLEQKVAERTAELEQANRELLRLATLDGLTQVANRRLFDEYLAQEWKRAFREQQPLSLILFDVDYFKRYNDRYGHQSGDDCLKQIAGAMSNAVKRSIDLAARYGGEEFAAILSNTEAEGAAIVAQEIRKQLQQLKILHAQSEVSEYVTLSLGIASIVPNSDTSPEDLIATADAALYEAKRQGRDRFVIKVLET